MSNNILAKNAAALAKSRQNQAKEEKVPNERYINIGVAVELDGEETFINIPLVLTADRIMECIKPIKGDENSKYNQILDGKNMLAEMVNQVFEKLDYGQSVKVGEIGDEVLDSLTIQFLKAKPAEKTEPTGSVFSKLIK